MVYSVYIEEYWPGVSLCILTTELASRQACSMLLIRSVIDRALTLHECTHPELNAAACLGASKQICSHVCYISDNIFQFVTLNLSSRLNLYFLHQHLCTALTYDHSCSIIQKPVHLYWLKQENEGWGLAVSQHKTLEVHLEFYGDSLLGTHQTVCFPFQHTSVRSLWEI